MQPDNNSFKYFAFISYSSRNTDWGKRLQRKLEHYRMPATLCSEHNWQTKTPLRPVFFAPTDIQPGDLSEELKQRLAASRHLIVICSPESARSEWVGKEIAFFHSLGRAENIHFFIVKGQPHSDDPELECFNPVVNELNLPEILGVNIHEKVFRLPWLNRERAYIQLITKLLGIDFDALWKRHRRLLIRQFVVAVLTSIAVVIMIFVASVMHRPVDVSVRLNEVTPANSSLPPLSDARVTLILDNETKDTTLLSISDNMVFSNIPADMIGREARIRFCCANYRSLDTTLVLSEAVTLNISRDASAYGNIHFTLYDQQVRPVPGARILVEGIEAMSDSQGKVEVFVPIDRQRKVYRLTSPDVTLIDTLKDAKCGNNDAVFCK